MFPVLILLETPSFIRASEVNVYRLKSKSTVSKKRSEADSLCLLFKHWQRPYKDYERNPLVKDSGSSIRKISQRALRTSLEYHSVYRTDYKDEMLRKDAPWNAFVIY